ncbi:PHP domain-containing protein [Alteromonas sp. CYL-A6]|uniref:PHP domain-containing protein n=1 Tax=Alteromonas nitratireducens TaxID=3390813 RepID=UPI0034B18785
MKIDLHSHTRYSDGHLSPRELVLRAHSMQVDVLAITDHDTVAGLDEAHTTQAEQSRPMTLIDGVELSTRWHAFDIHIVGLNVNRQCPGFNEVLRKQAETRHERAVKIGEKLAKCGFEGVEKYAFGYAAGGQVTRAHYARALVDHYGVGSMANAFGQYLGKGKRAEVKAKWISIAEAVEAIHAAGGQAVLAHPAHYDMTTKWLRRLVAEFAAVGGDAMEAACPGMNPEKQKLVNALVIEHDLLASAGSDFHFPSRWTELGRRLTLDSALTPVWHDWDCVTATK